MRVRSKYAGAVKICGCCMELKYAGEVLQGARRRSFPRTFFNKFMKNKAHPLEQLRK